jgi:cysteine desulfurase
MAESSIYLDNNATTSIDPRVIDAMARAWRDCGANPESQHAPGRRARRMLEEAREGIAALLGAKTAGMDADQLIFTSGGTEANNLALLGLPLAGTKPGSGVPDAQQPPRILISPIEHPSIGRAADELRRRGCDNGFIAPATADGLVAFDPAAVKLAQSPPRLVSLMLANNETGVLQPVAELAAHFRGQNAHVHTDAVQAVGKIPVDFRALGVDAMTVAPHKFHGPVGIGALVLRHGVTIEPRLFGGFQQAALRPGTESVALAVAFHEALRLAIAELPQRSEHMRSLRDDFEQRLLTELPELVIIGGESPRLPNTSCLAFPGLDRQQLVMALDVAGVACSTGSACASGSSEPSPTLLAMGLPKAVVESAVRFSLSAFTTARDMADASRRILNAVKHLRTRK